MSSKYKLSRNASNRIGIETESVWKAWKICLLLMFEYRFKRKGRYILGSDEVIYRNYVKSELKVNSAWDISFGYHWSAENEYTDEFLVDFFNMHLS